MTANHSAPMPVVVTAACATPHQRLGANAAHDLVITIPCCAASPVMPEIPPLSWAELLGQR